MRVEIRWNPTREDCRRVAIATGQYPKPLYIHLTLEDATKEQRESILRHPLTEGTVEDFLYAHMADPKVDSVLFVAWAEGKAAELFARLAAAPPQNSRDYQMWKQARPGEEIIRLTLASTTPWTAEVQTKDGGKSDAR